MPPARFSGRRGPGAALILDDCHRLPLAEPGAGGGHLIEPGRAEPLADPLSSTEIARDTARRSAASSPSVELTKTRSRRSGVRITGQEL